MDFECNDLEIRKLRIETKNLRSLSTAETLNWLGLEFKELLNKGGLKGHKIFTHHLTHHRDKTIL